MYLKCVTISAASGSWLHSYVCWGRTREVHSNEFHYKSFRLVVIAGKNVRQLYDTTTHQEAREGHENALENGKTIDLDIIGGGANEK